MTFRAPCPICIRHARAKGHSMTTKHVYWQRRLGTQNPMRHTTRFGRAYHSMAKKAQETQ